MSTWTCRHHRATAASAGVLLLLVNAPVSGQDTSNPLGQPLLDGPWQVKEEMFLSPPLHPDDERYANIRGDRLKALLMDVDAISLLDRNRGNLFWGRNIGTWGHVATQDWVEARFRSLGLTDVHRQPIEVGQRWNPVRWDISFSVGGETFELESARPPQGAVSTPPEGLELELVWVGAGSDADYLGREVRGKAVLIQDIPLPGDIRHTVAIEGAVARAFEKGAAAVGIIFGVSDNFAIWQRVTAGPGFNLGYSDGMRLRELLGSGERVTVRYVMESEMVEPLPAAHVWGTLPGTTDEEILIIAHLDGYFQAALDNASGLAVLVGLAEHFAARPRSERPRTIRFLASVGHHNGPGTRDLAENQETALPNTVLAINLEHVAAVRTKYWGPSLRMTNAVSPMRWWVWGSEDLLAVVLDSFRRFHVGVTADMDPGASGEMSRLARALPSIQVITSPEVKHTEQDTPEWVPAAGLEQIARAYARILDGVNGLSRVQLQPLIETDR